MSEEIKGAGGSPEAEAGGQQRETQTVSYQSYQKAVDEVKSAKAKAQELESRLSAIEEAKLNEQGDYKKLVELRESRIKELETQLKGVASERDNVLRENQDTWKLQAFHSALDGKIKKPEYLSFVDLESIVIDPETKQVDASSVQNVVSSFMENYSDLVEKKSFKGLPSDAPRGAVKKSFNQMTLDEKRAVSRAAISNILNKG